MKYSKLFKYKNGENFVYLTKFSVGEDIKTTFNIRAGYSAPLEGDYVDRTYSFYYVVVADDHWDEFLANDDWSNRLHLAKINQSLLVKGDGFWSKMATHTFVNNNRARVFYIGTINCHRGFHIESPWHPKMWMEVRAFNRGEHFSEEDWGLLTINYIMLITFIAFLFFGGYRYIIEIKKEGSWESPMGILVIALIIEFFHIIMNVMHLSVYEVDGEGLPTMDIMGTILQVISQVVIVTLLLLISFGWTLTYPHLPEKETIAAFTIMVLIIHVLVASLTLLDKDEYHKYHDYSGVQGFVLVVLRLIMFGVFIYGIQLTKTDIKKTHENFLRLFSISGSFYVLSFPILYFVSYIWDPYVRNRVIVFGHFILQTLSWILLLVQLSSKTSGYKKAKVKTIFGM